MQRENKKKEEVKNERKKSRYSEKNETVKQEQTRRRNLQKGLGKTEK